MSEKRLSNRLPELSEQDAELLSAYIDDMLTVEERAELETRLEDNAFLRHELAAMQQTIDWVKQLPPLKAPRNFTITAEDVERAAAREAPQKVLRPNFGWLIAGTAAAVVVMFVGILIVLRPTVGAVVSDVAQGLGAPAANQPNIALQSTSAPESEGNDARGDNFEQLSVVSSSTPRPSTTPLVLPITGGGATASAPIGGEPPSENRQDEAQIEEEPAAEVADTENEAAAQAADSDVAVGAASNDEVANQSVLAAPTATIAVDLQATQVVQVQLADVQQTGTSLALTFNATATPAATQTPAEQDGTTVETVARSSDDSTARGQVGGVVPPATATSIAPMAQSNNVGADTGAAATGEFAAPELAESTALPQTSGAAPTLLEIARAFIRLLIALLEVIR